MQEPVSHVCRPMHARGGGGGFLLILASQGPDVTLHRPVPTLFQGFSTPADCSTVVVYI